MLIGFIIVVMAVFSPGYIVRDDFAAVLLHW